MNVGRSLNQLVRSVSATYAVPWLAALLLLCGLAAFVVARFLPAPLAWLAGACGAVAFTAAVGIVIYAVLRNPDLLRSEHHVTTMRKLEIVYGEPGMTETELGRLSGPAIKVPHETGGQNG